MSVIYNINVQVYLFTGNQVSYYYFLAVVQTFWKLFLLRRYNKLHIVVTYEWFFSNMILVLEPSWACVSTRYHGKLLTKIVIKYILWQAIYLIIKHVLINNCYTFFNVIIYTNCSYNVYITYYCKFLLSLRCKLFFQNYMFIKIGTCCSNQYITGLVVEQVLLCREDSELARCLYVQVALYLTKHLLFCCKISAILKRVNATFLSRNLSFTYLFQCMYKVSVCLIIRIGFNIIWIQKIIYNIRFRH